MLSSCSQLPEELGKVENPLGCWYPKVFVSGSGKVTLRQVVVSWEQKVVGWREERGDRREGRREKRGEKREKREKRKEKREERGERRTHLKSESLSPHILQTAVLQQIVFRGFLSFGCSPCALLPSKWSWRPPCGLQGRSEKQ